MKRIIVRIALADVLVLKRMASARRISEAGLIRFGLTRFLPTLSIGPVPEALRQSLNSPVDATAMRLNISLRRDDYTAVQLVASKFEISMAAVIREAILRLIRSDRDRAMSVAPVPQTTAPIRKTS